MLTTAYDASYRRYGIVCVRAETMSDLDLARDVSIPETALAQRCRVGGVEGIVSNTGNVRQCLHGDSPWDGWPRFAVSEPQTGWAAI